MSAHEAEVAAYIGGGISTALTGEERVDGEPRKSCSTLSVAQVVTRAYSRWDERRGGGGQAPGLWAHQVDGRMCRVEVIEVTTTIAVLTLVVPREELRHLCREGEGGGLCEVDEGEVIQ